MCRRISEIKNLPISQLSDEEIVKAAMHRLQAKAIVMGILDSDNNTWLFIKYKTVRGKWYCQTMQHLYRHYFKISKRITRQK